MFLLAIAFAVFSATLLGGLFAVWLKDRLHMVLGFSAGAVVGVAFLDLLPEAFMLNTPAIPVPVTALYACAGFLFYLVLDRVALLHAAHDEDHDAAHAPHTRRGVLGAATFLTHSFFDGIAIGFAFQVSRGVGIAVAAAVLAHDFSDGINTTHVVLKNGGGKWEALRWLLADALAPVAGIAATFLVAVRTDYFGPILAVLAGFFLYLGASDLVPESHHSHPKPLTTIMTLLGAGVIYLSVRYAG